MPFTQNLPFPLLLLLLILKKYQTISFQLFTTISYAVAYLSDGLLYIFMNDKVRKVFWKKIRKMSHKHNNSECTLVRCLAVRVERNLPLPDRDSIFSHSENAALFHENLNVQDRSPQHHGSSITTSVSSIEMYGVVPQVPPLPPTPP